MATTPNYGWVTPAPTDFVTDLPADFETFADAVDADLAGLLGGTTGQVLSKDSNSDHDFSWTTPSVFTPTSWTLVNSGGTSLSGNSEITISGLGSYNQIAIWVNDFKSATANVTVRVQFDGDTGNNYNTAGFGAATASTWNGNQLNRSALIAAVPTNYVLLSVLANTASSEGQAFVQVTGCSQSSPKMYNVFSGHNGGSSGSGHSHIAGGYWDNSSTIDTIRVFTAGAQNFNAGTLRVYGSVN